MNSKKRGGFHLYSLKNRVSAFIFIADTFIQAESHTQCVINILISEHIIKDDKEFYQQMKNPLSKKYIEGFIEQIENQSVFGEFNIYHGRMAVIVFDKLNSFGIYSIKNKSKELFGDIPLYYLNLENNKRQLTELYG